MANISCGMEGQLNYSGLACQQDRLRGVDVIIAAWNREDTIGRSVASALAEPEVLSVLVVDDGSTDETAKWACSADDGSNRLTVLQLPENRGPAAARNAALAFSKSSAPWITVLDGDDFLLPGRFSRLLAQAQRYDVIADDLLQVHEDCCDVGVQLLARAAQFEPWDCDLGGFVLGNLARKGHHRKELGFLKPLIRRSFLEKYCLRYDETLRLGEDYAFYAQLLAMGARFRIVPACGYVSVVRSGSLSGKHSKQDLERLRDIDFVLEALPGLSAAERAMIRKHQKSIDARVQWLEVIEAVKAKNASRILRAYCRSPQVAQYLTARLSEQLFERTSKRLKAFTEAQEGNRLSPSSGALDFWVTGDRDANRQGGLKPEGVSL